MIRLDFKCDNDHTTEVECDRNKIPDSITCPVCTKYATRVWSGMGIRSKTYVGTGGGRDMIQKKSEA